MLNNYTKYKSLWYSLFALAILPIFIFRDFTPDNELRYLSIADEALRNGSIFTFTNHGIPYADKPPLYLWIVMLGKILFGKHSMVFLGIFSFVPALVVLFFMDKWTKDVLSESERLLGQLMLITSGYFIGAAVVLRMDMLMCMFIVLSLYTFFKMYSGAGKPRDTLLFPLYVFMAVFTKGPVGILVPLISTTVFLFTKGELKTIGRYWGWKTLVVLFILCGLWFTGVYVESGSSYLHNLLFNQTVNRAVNSFHHKESLFYYLKVIWYSLAPWSLLYIGILVMGLKKKMATTDLERFFLVVALSTFAMLSLFSSKLAVYMLPAFPFFAYIAVLWLSKFSSSKWVLSLIGIPACIFSLALPGAIVALVSTKGIDLFTSLNILVAFYFLSLSSAISFKYLFEKKLEQGIITMSIGMLLFVFTISFSIPKLNSFIGLRDVCHQAKELASHKKIENYYFFERSRAENMDVYLGKESLMLSEKDLSINNNSIKKPAILFLRQKDLTRNVALQRFVQGKHRHQVGKYYYVEIEK